VVTLARALRPTYAPGGPFIVYTGKQSYSRIFSEWNVLKRKKNETQGLGVYMKGQGQQKRQEWRHGLGLYLGQRVPIGQGQG
jgi:hypothetical protein